jgi:hypothetical protein
VVDPRTLRAVTKASDCHLIPECFDVSNKTVSLDGPFDSKVGQHCDCQLKLFADMLVAKGLRGNFTFKGGSQRMAGTIFPNTQQFRIDHSVRINKKRRHKRWTPRDWCRKALGLTDDGQVQIEGFVGPTVDLAKARLSMVNSAFLVVHYLGRKEVLRPEFDQARELLAKVCEGRLERADLPLIEELTPTLMAVFLPGGSTPSGPTDLRKYYDPDLDIGDGVLDDFPTNCVVQQDNDMLVRLPYGKGLRGVVRFPVVKGKKGTRP